MTKLEQALAALLNSDSVALAAEGAADNVAEKVKEKTAEIKELGELVYYKLYLKAPEALDALSHALDTHAANVGSCLTVGTIGPTIATHVGLGAMGLFRFPADLHATELNDLDRYLTPTF